MRLHDSETKLIVKKFDFSKKHIKMLKVQTYLKNPLGAMIKDYEQYYFFFTKMTLDYPQKH